MPTSRLINSQLSLLTDNNNNISPINSIMWKSWIKPITFFGLSSTVSIITSPIVAIANYWKKTTKLDFISGWNSFISSPAAFVSSELINSFFYTLAFFRIEFCLDIILNNRVTNKEKLKQSSKDVMLVMSLLFINEISKNVMHNQLNNEEIWNELFKDFAWSFDKEIVIVIAWKIFKMCLTNNRDCNDYFNSALTLILFGISYVNVNILQTLYNASVWQISLFEFMTNFKPIFVSNSIIGCFRIVSSSLLTCFFNDIATKWKNDWCNTPSDDEVALLQEVVTDSINRSYNTFTNPIVNVNLSNNQQLNRSVSYESFFNIQKINNTNERVDNVNNSQTVNVMRI